MYFVLHRWSSKKTPLWNFKRKLKSCIVFCACAFFNEPVKTNIKTYGLRFDHAIPSIIKHPSLSCARSRRALTLISNHHPQVILDAFRLCAICYWSEVPRDVICDANGVVYTNRELLLRVVMWSVAGLMTNVRRKVDRRDGGEGLGREFIARWEIGGRKGGVNNNWERRERGKKEERQYVCVYVCGWWVDARVCVCGWVRERGKERKGASEEK